MAKSDDAFVVATASVAAAIENMAVLAKRGLASPGEVEAFADAIIGILDQPEGSKLGAKFEAHFAPRLAEIRRDAETRWLGDPDQRLR